LAAAGLATLACLTGFLGFGSSSSSFSSSFASFSSTSASSSLTLASSSSTFASSSLFSSADDFLPALFFDGVFFDTDFGLIALTTVVEKFR
jgi:hypothetical protein